MTIHRQNDSRIRQGKDTTNDEELHPAVGGKKLSVNNPLIYFFILFGVILRPEKLKAYRMRLNMTEKLHFQLQASRVATTLIWVPLLTVFALIWLTGMVQVGTETAVFMYLITSICAFSTYRYGLSKDLETQNNLLLGSMFSVFGLMAILFSGIYNSEFNGELALLLSILVLLFSLTALCVSMVFKLKTLDMLAGFVCLFIVGGVSIVMSQVMTQIWMPVIVIMVSVLWVGITEERHDLNNNQQHQAQR
ncbi:MAG: hypothetical protein AAF490_25760 [Chloroflexota bacterium]